MWRASRTASATAFSPSTVMTPAPPPRASVTLATARTVPEAPTARSQPRRRNPASTGSNWVRAASTARCQARPLRRPSGKWARVQLMHPMCRLSRSRGFKPSPTMTSVLPPPMSTTRRRSLPDRQATTPR